MALLRNDVAQLPDAGGVADADLLTLSREGRWWKIAPADLAAWLIGQYPPPSSYRLPDIREYGARVNDPSYAYNHEAFIAASVQAQGLVSVPQGAFTFQGLAALAVNSPTSFVGAGSKTVIRQANPSSGAFLFDSTSYLAGGGGLSNMVIEAGSGFRTAGSFGIGSSACAVRANHRNETFYLNRVEVNNFADPFQFYGCWNFDLDTFWVHFYSGNAILMERGWDGGYGVGSRFISGGARIKGGLITNNGASFSTTNSVALRSKASGGNRFTLLEMTSGGRGVVVDPSDAAGEQVLYDKYAQVMPDTMIGNGWEFSADGKIWSITITDCWSSYNGGNGVVTNNPNIRTMRWLGGNLRQNVLSGWRHANGKEINISGAEIADNNRLAQTTPYYHGVEIDAGAGGITIDENRFSNDTGDGSQQFCVVARAGAGSDIIVTRNDMRNAYSASAGISMLATGAGNLVMGNTPRGVPGHSPDDAITLNGAQPQISDTPSTVYFGPLGSSNADVALGWVVGAAGVVSEMSIAGTLAPGSGKTVAYTLRKNGVSTGITASRTGTSGFLAVANGAVTVAKNDVLTIMRVTDSGAVTNDERYYLRIER